MAELCVADHRNDVIQYDAQVIRIQQDDRGVTIIYEYLILILCGRPTKTPESG
jgi:hypothetical protein